MTYLEGIIWSESDCRVIAEHANDKILELEVVLYGVSSLSLAPPTWSSAISAEDVMQPP